LNLPILPQEVMWFQIPSNHPRRRICQEENVH